MLQKLLIIRLSYHIDVKIGSNNHKKRPVSVGLCVTLSLVLAFGSVFSSASFNLLFAFAADMPGGSMDGGDGGQGSKSGPETGDGGQGSTSGPETGDGGGSDNNNDNDDNGNRSERNRDNDDESRTKDTSVTTDTNTAKKSECPKGQERTLFSGACKFGEDTSPLEQSDTLDDFLGVVDLQHKNPKDADLPGPTSSPAMRAFTPGIPPNSWEDIKISTKKNGDGSSTEVYKSIGGKEGETTEVTITPKDSIEYVYKGKDQVPTYSSSYTPDTGITSITNFVDGKPSITESFDYKSGKILKKIEVAPDDSYTQTSTYGPSATVLSTPPTIVTDYRDGRQVTSTFEFGRKIVSEYNPKDGGWTTTKSTDQRTGIITTEITKTNPDGSISTMNPDDNSITTRNKDGTWFMTFPPSQDGSVKIYHSDGRTTIEKGKPE